MNYQTHSVFVRRISPDMVDLATEPGNGYIEFTIQNLRNTLGNSWVVSSAYDHIDGALPFERMQQNIRQRRIFIPEHNQVWALEAGNAITAILFIYEDEEFEEV